MCFVFVSYVVLAPRASLLSVRLVGRHSVLSARVGRSLKGRVGRAGRLCWLAVSHSEVPLLEAVA